MSDARPGHPRRHRRRRHRRRRPHRRRRRHRRRRHRGRPGRRAGRRARSTPTACSSPRASSTSTPTTTARRSWDERMIPSSWHGVTTVVAGNCGVGFAPVRPADHDRLIELMEGVEDIPGVVLARGPVVELAVASPSSSTRSTAGRFDVDVAAAGPPRRAAPPRHGRAGRQPRAGDRRRHRRDGARSRAEGDRGRRARLHDLAHAQPPHQPGRAHADAHRRGRRARRHRRAPSAPPARACCRWCPTSPTSTPSSRIFRRMAERVGPAAVVLAGADPRGDGWRRQLELLDRGQRRRACR